MAAETPQEQELKETGRIEAFSDGVFAVAVTLLILTIQVPPAVTVNKAQVNIPAFVLGQWPFFLAYVVSFITILIMWANHHSIFNLVVRADRILIILNGILLILITFFDYPTAIIAAALNEGHYQKFAAMFYTGTLFVVTIVYNIFWRYIAAHPHLIDSHVSLDTIKKISGEYRFGPLFYAAAVLFSYFSALAGVLITLLLAIYFALTARIAPVHGGASRTGGGERESAFDG
jgi:uncharacterized membrane protein